MLFRSILVVCLVVPATLRAQGVRADTSRHVADSATAQSEMLHAITVTAAPARRTEASSSVHVTSDAIQSTPAINPFELVRQTSGLEVHDQGQGPGFAGTVSMRGFSADHSTDLALWIDGVPINEPVNGHAEGYNDFSLIFPAVVRDIDVYKGPSSALFGNFALAGTVNVRTLERMQGTDLNLSGGAYGRVDGSLITGFDHPNSGGVFAIRGVSEDGWRPNSGYDLGQMHARLVRDLSPNTSLDASIELYATEWKSPGFLTTEQFADHDFQIASDKTDGGFKRRAQERVSLRVLTGANSLWRTTVYATQGRWQLFLNIPPEPGSGEGTGSQTEEEDTRFGFGLTSAFTWSDDRREVTIGGEGRWDHSDYQNWLTQSRIRQSAQDLLSARQVSGALFVQSAINVGHHLRFSLGGRYDDFSTQDTPDGDMAVTGGHGVFSPKLGALYRLTRQASVYANVSRGFRQTDGIVEDPTLPIITEWAYESGVKFDGAHTQASIALFRMDVSNEQTFDPITLSTTSGGASRRQGVELGLRSQVTPTVSLTTDLTLNDAKYRSLITDDGDTLNGTTVFNTSKYVGSIALEIAPAKAHWRARVGSNLVGPYTPFDDPGIELPAYALFYASGELTVGRNEIQLGVRNAFNHIYPELRAGDFVSPGQPRSFYVGVRHGW